MDIEISCNVNVPFASCCGQSDCTHNCWCDFRIARRMLFAWDIAFALSQFIHEMLLLSFWEVFPCVPANDLANSSAADIEECCNLPLRIPKSPILSNGVDIFVGQASVMVI